MQFSTIRRQNRVLKPLKSTGLEHTRPIICSVFQNLRLGSIIFQNLNILEDHTGTKRRSDVKKNNRDSGILGTGMNRGTCNYEMINACNAWQRGNQATFKIYIENFRNCMFPCEWTFGNAFSKYFSKGWVLDLVLRKFEKYFEKSAPKFSHWLQRNMQLRSDQSVYQSV